MKDVAVQVISMIGHELRVIHLLVSVIALFGIGDLVGRIAVLVWCVIRDKRKRRMLDRMAVTVREISTDEPDRGDGE